MKLKPPFQMKVESGMEFYRYETFWTKEPETIAWIRSFSPGDLFIDVGANIGVYTLFAASLGHDVIAIEPDRKNFLRLCENVILNGFENVTLLNAGAGAYRELGNFYNKTRKVGDSGGQIFPTPPLQFQYKVPILCLDDFIRGENTHIKIDVDGQEMAVMAGLEYRLSIVKSLLIEVSSLDDEYSILMKAQEGGLSYDNAFNYLEDHSRVRRAKEGINAENIIFTRP